VHKNTKKVRICKEKTKIICNFAPLKGERTRSANPPEQDKNSKKRRWLSSNQPFLKYTHKR